MKYMKNVLMPLTMNGKEMEPLSVIEAIIKAGPQVILALGRLLPIVGEALKFYNADVRNEEYEAELQRRMIRALYDERARKEI